MNHYPLAPLRAILAAFSVAVLLLVSYGAALASPTHKLLILSYNENGFPPYLIQENGQFSGITVDILKQALKNLDFELVITLHPEKRGQELLERGGVDARGKAREWVPDPERYDWSEPFLEPTSVIVSKAATPISTPTIQAMRGMSIARPENFI